MNHGRKLIFGSGDGLLKVLHQNPLQQCPSDQQAQEPLAANFRWVADFSIPN